MTATEALATARRLLLDTAPVIYYVEAHPRYRGLVEDVFQRLDRGSIHAVTSPITLAECLVVPYRNGDAALLRAFTGHIVRGVNTTFALLDEARGARAAELRARYNLPLADAFQVATAIDMNCDGLLTNDLTLKRANEVTVIVLDDVLAEMQRAGPGTS